MENKQYKTVCAVDSAYALFLYFLVTGNSIENTFFLFSNRIPREYREKLSRNSLRIKVPRNRVKILHYLCQLYYLFYLPFFFKRKKLKDLPVYGFDFLEWTNPILTFCKDFSVIEDGFGNYTMPSIELKRFNSSIWRSFLIKHIKIFHLPFGLSDKVKRVYLTGLLPIPKEIEHKVSLIDMQSLWRDLNADRKTFLIKFFMGNSRISMNSGRKVLLLSQCWSEEHLITENEKIALYRYIIDHYGESNVVLKTHPRETTKYENYFPNLEIISEPIPFQLIMLLGMKFDIAVSINSTAIFSLGGNCKKIIIIPTELPSDNLFQFMMDKCHKALGK